MDAAFDHVIHMELTACLSRTMTICKTLKIEEYFTERNSIYLSHKWNLLQDTRTILEDKAGSLC